MEPCRYYAVGLCAKGACCRFQHEAASSNSSSDPISPSKLRGDAAPFFLPKPQCSFFRKGRCDRGSLCRFGHDTAPIPNPVETKKASDPDQAVHQVAKTIDSLHLNASFEYRDLGGAVVAFDHGALVQSIVVANHDHALRTDSKSESELMPKQPSARLRMSTVSCSWFKPSRIAWLHYGSHDLAKGAANRFKKALGGRQLHAKVIEPRSSHFRGVGGRGGIGPRRASSLLWSVELTNLDTRTTKDELMRNLTGLPPRDIQFGASSSTLTDEQACDAVKAVLIRAGGKLADFHVSNNTQSGKVKAFARFEDQVQATTIRSISEQEIPNLRSPLHIALIASVKIPILADLYNVLEASIDLLRYKEMAQARISVIPPEMPGKAVIVRIYGENATGVAKQKLALERLLEGRVVTNKAGAILWDDFFSTQEGLVYLRGLNVAGQLFLYRDMRKRRLTLHGSQALFDGTTCAVVARLSELSRRHHTIDLSVEMLENAVRGGFRQVVGIFGKQHAKLDVVKKTMTIQGSLADAQRANVIISSPGEPITEQTDTAIQECPACMMECEEPVELGCGHSYCLDCLTGQCEAAEGAQIPICCYGDSAKCRKHVDLSLLKAKLRHDHFDGLLLRSFNNYIESHSDVFQYCPTADCPSVYRIGDEGHNTICNICLAIICTACQSVSHDGLTCEENRDAKTESYQDFQKWKRENDVKDCPTCKAPIEKSYGCNHMTCSRCSTHICWYCMETFKTGTDCYVHMEVRHSGYGG